MREEHTGGRLHDSSSLTLREHPLGIPAVLIVHLQIMYFHVKNAMFSSSTHRRDIGKQRYSSTNS